jgi:hypothetical protein
MIQTKCTASRDVKFSNQRLFRNFTQLTTSRIAMNSLFETGSILSAKEGSFPEGTTKLVAPMGDDDPGGIDFSRIPKKYHIVRTFPIFPKDYAEQGYRCYNKDGNWNVVLWPSANPDSRKDCQYLSDAVRLMLDEIR